MKQILKPAIVLMIYGLIAGIGLGYINSITAPKILQIAKDEQLAAMKAVLPDAGIFRPESVMTCPAGPMRYSVGYKSESDSTPVGYIVTAYGNGFSSTIRTIVGLKPDLTINAVKVVYQQETPGLGTRSQEPWFQKQFAGRNTKEGFAVKKDGGEIEAITGATISSRAVTNSIKAAVDTLEKYLPKPETTDTTMVSDSEQEGGEK